MAKAKSKKTADKESVLRKIRSKSKMLITANLETVGDDGKIESIFIAPRESRDLTEAQFNSREIQNLIKDKMLVVLA